MPSPYARLLLQIINVDPTVPDPKKLETLTVQEWEALTTEAIRCRLAYQFHEYLKDHEPLLIRVPELCLEQLNQTIRSAFLLNLQSQAQLQQLLENCQAEGITFLLMKGLWIVYQIYQSMEARASGDIDILLKPEDIPRFTRLLQRHGYQLDSSICDLRDISLESNEFHLQTPDGSSRLDVHWSMTHPQMEASIDEAKIWERSTSITMGARSCQSLCFEDHLLLLCYHAAIHHRFLYVGPRALVDVAQAIKTPPRPIRWEDFIARAQEMGWDRGVWLMLDLAREHLGVQPPRSVLDMLRPENAGDTAIREAALSAMFVGRQSKVIMSEDLVKLFSRRNYGDICAHVFRRLFSSPSYIAGYFQLSIHDPRLPWLFPWLYIKRWMSILHNNVSKLIMLAARDPGLKSELERSQTIISWLEL